MRARHSSAFSVASTKGRVTWLNSTPSNCVSRLWPSICAVMPVPSETKNTVRRMGQSWESHTVAAGEATKILCRMRVAWLKDLRHDATCAQVGGKNASLGEMIGALAAAGIRVPGGFATTARRLPRVPRRERSRAAHRASACASLDADDVKALAACGTRDPRLDHGRSRFPQALEERDSVAVSRACRQRPQATPRSPCAPPPPPKTCPTPRSPGSRRPSSTSAASTTCCEAIRHVFASLYNDRAISYRVHQGFDARRRSRSRPACSGWCAATSAPPA